MRRFLSLYSVLWLWVSASVCFAQEETKAELQREIGKSIFTDTCADCHGVKGEGVEDVYSAALVGDDSIGQLAKYISQTMPEGSPEDCVAEEAEAVAEYIHHAFYSEAAQIRNRPPRVRLARLTSEQLRQSLADLYASFVSLPPPDKDWEWGVSAKYYNDSRRSKNLKTERIDPAINFDFGRASPVEGIKPEAFAIEWEGGLWAEDSGLYEIVVRSSCSFVMTFGHHDRELINNHVQSGDKTEFRVKTYLTGGRVYPFNIAFQQRKRKTEIPPANISLSWVTPGGRERVVPQRNLVADWVPPVFALQTQLPPDDRSYGYERGIYVNREWDESTTSAALEFAEVAFKELWPEYQRKHKKDKKSQRERLRGFLIELLGTAFHASLTDDQVTRYIDKQLGAEQDDFEAFRRVVLLGLKSPMFLYPLADPERSKSQQVANRLALTLFDSLPVDGWLKEGGAKGDFAHLPSARTYAERHVEDFRVRLKTRAFLHSWLNQGHVGEITKDSEMYSGFDEELVADLKQSFELFLDDIVWSEDSDYRQLFLSKRRFASERLRAFYDENTKENSTAATDSGNFTASEVKEQFGLLSHPFLLSSLAYHDSTSPIHRGVFLIRYMLGRTLRPPAEAFTPLSPDLHPDLTTRERVELQTSPSSCQMCHSKINGLGFVMENYDAVGKFRTNEGEKTIDSLGSYTTKTGELVKFAGLEDLAKFLAGSEDAQQSFVRRAFQHFVKQAPAAYGADTLSKLTESFRNNNYNIKKLIVEIAYVAATQSPPTPDIASAN